jgi:anaerobic sulfite reductase subunit B
MPTVSDAPTPARVLSRRQETHDTWTIELEPGAAYAPGQFAMLYAFGAGEAPISVSRIGARNLHTIRTVGSVTAALCEAEVIGVRGPYGNAWPLAQAAGRDVMVIAGGIGLAPLRPVIDALLDDPDRYGRVSVLYGARSPSELLYTEELERWGSRLNVGVIVDAPVPGWRGPVGVVTRLIKRAELTPERTVAVMCGPEVMMRFCAAELRARGVPGEAIWVSLERSMKCGIGHCGHCQLGPLLICRDGAVFRHDQVEPLMRVAQL